MQHANVNYEKMIIRKVVRRIPVADSRSVLGWFLLSAFFITTVVFCFFVGRLYLQSKNVVENHLKGQRWSLPSTIYADAPVLYEGMPMKPQTLIQYLQRLNYERTQQPEVRIGQYSVQKDGIAFYKHTVYPEQLGDFPVLVKFRSSRIEKIVRLSGDEEVIAFELEPATISNLFGSDWEKRTLVRYKDIPQHLAQAVLAIEDRRFFQHGGLDPKGILRAIWNDLWRKRQLQGGSTITQQLTKNFYLTPERSVRRKVSEAMLSWVMERRLKKEEILELYLNEIYLGQRGAMNINGVQEASRLYFRKDVQHITVPEAALLAGMIQAPNAYNPYRHPKEAKDRRDTVLRAMKETGAIDQKEYEKFVASKVEVYPIDARINLAPYFGQVVKSQLLEKYEPES
ncbi:MAG TPA: transglycosylase domain-containing protein, partial [Acidobacteriota bacterium]|nr:transglycosylase domain-containing protein [Acidobacteriota bacterium]